MSKVAIGSVIKEFDNTFKVCLAKVQRKQIIFDGKLKNGESIVVISPSSKVYVKGNGWVDLTKIQIDLLSSYTNSYAAFRLENGTVHYINLRSLYPLLDSSNILENVREGLHWKLDIWGSEIKIRNGGQVLCSVDNIESLV